MCDKAINTHSSTIQFVPESYKTQEMCDKTFNKSFFAFTYILDRYKTQDMCEPVVSEDPFSVRYIPGQYKTQKICDEAVDDCLAALKFVPDWFVRSKMVEKLGNALHANADSSNTWGTLGRSGSKFPNSKKTLNTTKITISQKNTIFNILNFYKNH